MVFCSYSFKGLAYKSKVQPPFNKLRKATPCKFEHFMETAPVDEGFSLVHHAVYHDASILNDICLLLSGSLLAFVIHVFIHSVKMMALCW